MTNILKLVHVLAVLALGVSVVSSVALFILLCAQGLDMLPYAATSLWDLVIAVTVAVSSFWYLRYIGDPDLLSSYIKAKLRIPTDDSEE